MAACITRPGRCGRGTACAAAACSTPSAPAHGVPHRKCGKLIVATNEAEARQDRGHRQAGRHQRRRRAGADRRQGGARARAGIVCAGALHSPETGIIDSHRYMLALRGDLEDAGGTIAFNTRVERRSSARDGQWQVRSAAREPGESAFDAVVNCGRARRAGDRARHAGLSAGARTAAGARQGQLFLLRGPPGVQAADLSDADARRARRACHARHGRPHALRARRGMDRAARTTTSIRRAPISSTRASAPIGRACRTIR